MQSILDNVLKRVKPTKKEEERVKAFASDVLRVAKTISGLDAVIVGSIGKFTWLADDHDVDIFILFPKDAPRSELEEKGLDFGKRIVEQFKGKARVKYAEHPYTHALIKGFDVDIVPCYHIQKGEHIQSAVDRSPLHLEYILEHTSPRMQDEVRLLKQFCKGIGVYGSDAKNQGFSGYICELLILYYQNFESVLKAAASWQAPQVIDVMGFTDRTKFPDQPLIIVDPVDKDRNAAAVVNGDSFVRFIAAAKQFVAEPAGRFFSPRDPIALTSNQAKYLANRGTRFVAVSMPTPDVIDDVLYPQLRKALKRLHNLLHHSEFRALRSYEFVGKKSYLIFELEIAELPPVAAQEGPPLFAKQHMEEFLSKYRGKNFVYLSGSRWMAEVKRAHRTAVDLLSSFLRRDTAKLIEDGIPKYIAEQVKGMKICEGKEFFALVRSDKELSSYVREKYFVDIGKII